MCLRWILLHGFSLAKFDVLLKPLLGHTHTHVLASLVIVASIAQHIPMRRLRACPVGPILPILPFYPFSWGRVPLLK